MCTVVVVEQYLLNYFICLLFCCFCCKDGGQLSVRLSFMWSVQICVVFLFLRCLLVVHWQISSINQTSFCPKPIIKLTFHCNQFWVFIIVWPQYPGLSLNIGSWIDFLQSIPQMLFSISLSLSLFLLAIVLN